MNIMEISRQLNWLSSKYITKYQLLIMLIQSEPAGYNNFLQFMDTWRESGGSGTENQMHNVEITMMYHIQLPHFITKVCLKWWNNIMCYFTPPSIIQGKISKCNIQQSLLDNISYIQFPLSYSFYNSQNTTSQSTFAKPGLTNIPKRISHKLLLHHLRIPRFSNSCSPQTFPVHTGYVTLV